MYCSNCGTRALENAEFCIVCGKQLTPVEKAQANSRLPERLAQTTDATQTIPGVATSALGSSVHSPSVFGAPPSRRAKRNYFVRHWRGELSLPISYWVNNVFATFVATLAFVTVGNMDHGEFSLKAIAVGYLGALVLWLLMWLWAVVGIWRSADQHVGRGGSSTWATVAKVMVVIGVLSTTGKLFKTILPQTKEMALIAIGNDPIGDFHVKVAANGKAIIVNGVLREGSADEIRTIIDSAPGATTLSLNSIGGRLLEARKLADIVRSRKLNTYVEKRCDSACTYVFLAGRDRAATPNARIGFHQPSFTGIDATEQRRMTAEMTTVYRLDGLPEWFLQRVSQTSSENMWYPTRDELIAANVINRVSLGGEVEIVGSLLKSKQQLILVMKSVPLFRAYERRFPGIIAKAAERAWVVKENGGSDEDIYNAGRQVLASTFPVLLKAADDETLERLAQLEIAETVAARAVSVNACTMALAGKLNIAQILPRELVERERQLMMHALTVTAPANRKPLDKARAAQVLQSLASALPQRYIYALTNSAKYGDQPRLICDATIAFYKAILRLPSAKRILALRSVFQGDN